MWHNGLRIQRRHCSSLGPCCGIGLILAPGTATCCGPGQNQQKKKKKPKTTKHLCPAVPFCHPYQCNSSLSLLLAGPASQLWCNPVFCVPKSYSAHQMRHQADLFPNGQLLNIPTSGSFLSQMDRTQLVHHLFPLTYLFSFVRPAVRIHPLI